MLSNCDRVQGVHWVNPNLFLISLVGFLTLFIGGFDVYPCLEYCNVQCMKLSFIVNCGGN